MYELGLWDERTFADIVDEHARTQPDKPAVTDARGRLTYRELSDLSLRLAAVLHEVGVQAGAPVAAQLPGCTLLPALHLACIRIGALFMPLSTAWRGAELRPLLAAVGAAVLVVPGPGGIAGDDFDFLGLAGSIRAEQPGLRAVLAARSGGKGAIEALAAAATLLTGEQLAAMRVPAEAPALVMSSSGTTGTPKAAVWGGNDLKALLLHNVVPRLRMTADDVAAGLAPAGTGSTGYIFPVLTPLLLGATAAILERWSPQAALDLIVAEGATYATAIPTQMVMLLPLALESADLSRFTRFNNAGAPLPPSTARELEERMGCRVQSIYGSTDGGVPVMTSVDDDEEVRRTTVGSICAGVDVRLVGADGAPVAAGEAGEVCWRDGKSYGYLNQPAYDAAAFDAERWFHSGDVGQFDDGGNLRIVGRIKDMILRGGTNIFPAEIEHLVSQHPAVADVSVVGVPDDRLGERACAVVVPVDGAALDLAGICAFLCEREVAVVKLPEELVLVAALPTNAGGKIDKAQVREHAVKELQSRSA
jgi:acyl-CoA synthetase (AMP-forming)/AMP-acid ligase II